MAAGDFLKFNQFVEDLGKELHNFTSDTLYALLTNTAPNAADTIVDTTTGTCTVKATSNAAEITAQNGYTKKGGTVTVVTWSQTSGTAKLVCSLDTEWTASGGTIGPFQYAVLYNDSGGTTSTRPVISFYNYEAAVTLQIGEKFTIDFNQANGILTIA